MHIEVICFLVIIDQSVPNLKKVRFIQEIWSDNGLEHLSTQMTTIVSTSSSPSLTILQSNKLLCVRESIVDVYTNDSKKISSNIESDR